LKLCVTVFVEPVVISTRRTHERVEISPDGTHPVLKVSHKVLVFHTASWTRTSEVSTKNEVPFCGAAGGVENYATERAIAAYR